MPDAPGGFGVTGGLGSTGGGLGGLRRIQALHENRLLAGVDERLGFLLIVRCALASAVVAFALFDGHSLGAGLTKIGVPCVLFLAAAGAVEWYRRRGSSAATHVDQAMLVADSLFLVAVTLPGGGVRSPLVGLFLIQIVSVTILAGNRTGLRIALWNSLLFLIIFAFSLTSGIDGLYGVHAARPTSGRAVGLTLSWFWAVAVCTALFSEVSERDLRRSRAELSALAGLSRRLEESHDIENILTTLLRTTIEAFGAPRAGLYWGTGGRLHSYTGTSRPGRPAQMMPSPLSSQPGVFDAVVMGAWPSSSATLVRRLDPVADPLLTVLLPAARNVVIVPLAAEGGQGGVLALEWGGRWRERVSRHSLTVLGQFSAHATLALRNAELVGELARMAALDPLTNLANRRELEVTLNREVQRAIRTSETLSLILFDVDHFKRVNDERGHLAGDEVLIRLAGALVGYVREMDVVARFGGEEFAVVLPCCEIDHATNVAERIRSGISRLPGLEGITLSAGIASVPQHASTGLELTAAADEALYAAKAAGRDRAMVASRFRVRPLGSAG